LRLGVCHCNVGTLRLIGEGVICGNCEPDISAVNTVVEAEGMVADSSRQYDLMRAVYPNGYERAKYLYVVSNPRREDTIENFAAKVKETKEWIKEKREKGYFFHVEVKVEEIDIPDLILSLPPLNPGSIELRELPFKVQVISRKTGEPKVVFKAEGAQKVMFMVDEWGNVDFQILSDGAPNLSGVGELEESLFLGDYDLLGEWNNRMKEKGLKVVTI